MSKWYERGAGWKEGGCDSGTPKWKEPVEEEKDVDAEAFGAANT